MFFWLECDWLAHGSAHGAQRVYVTKLKYFSRKIFAFMEKQTFWISMGLAYNWLEHGGPRGATRLCNCTIKHDT